MARAIMIQGAGSNVGKSLVVAGLCRAARHRGIDVAPFKPQNMSNNAAVTADGGEIGRAQALQARAAGREPVFDMNPVLLKPHSETGAQVIVHGKPRGALGARAFGQTKASLLPQVLESFHRLSASAELIVVEGAGSPAEVNLRAGDIANMGFAQAADVPVVLIGDIDRGGVIAQIVGTHAVLSPTDRDRIAAFLVNKFRGDPALFDDGMTTIAARTGWAPLGILPFFPDAWKLPAEDILDLATPRPGGPVRVAVPRLSRISNFDDLDPLAAEPGVTLTIVEPGRPLPGDAALVILPGSKATIADLAEFRAYGWDIDLLAHVRRGGHVLGICGGYQMMGRAISDPDGTEGTAGTVPGLGLLDVTTRLAPEKRLALTDARDIASGAQVTGYEIHLGETTGAARQCAWLTIGERTEGAADPTGRLRGTYLHGLFENDNFRAAFLGQIGAETSDLSYSDQVDATLDDLAAALETHLDLDALFALAR